MFSFFEYLDTNFINFLLTGELSPNINYIDICHSFDDDCSIGNKRLEYIEFTTYLKRLQGLCETIINDGNNVVYILRPFWNYAKLKHIGGLNKYHVRICIPFSNKNLSKLRNFFINIDKENSQCFINSLCNKKVKTLQCYLDEVVADSKISILNNETINREFINRIVCCDENKLTNIKLLVIDCVKNGESRFIYKSNNNLTSFACKLLLSFYSGFIVSTFDKYGFGSNYLVVGTGFYDKQICEFLGEDLITLDSNDIDDIYVSDACAFIADPLPQNSLFTFRVNCGTSLRKLFCSDMKINLKIVSKSRIKETVYFGKILKLLKNKRIKDIICRIGDINRSEDWEVVCGDSNFSLGFSAGSLKLDLDAFQVGFSMLNCYTLKNFYQKEMIDYSKQCIGFYDTNNVNVFLARFDNSGHAYPSGMSALYSKKEGLFYYSNTCFFDIGDSIMNNHIAMSTVKSNMFQVLLLPLSYARLVLLQFSSFTRSSLYSFVKGIKQDISGSYYTKNFSNSFYNSNWKDADKFLKCEDLISHVMLDTMQSKVNKASCLFNKIMGDSLSFPSIMYSKELANGDLFLFTTGSKNYLTGFYSLEDDLKLFLDGNLRTFDLSCALNKLNRNYYLVFIVSSELLGSYFGLQTSETFYNLMGYHYKLFASIFSSIDNTTCPSKSIVVSYSKSLDKFFNNNSTKCNNEFLISIEKSFIDNKGSYTTYLLPRTEIHYHNRDTVINPLYGFASGCTRLYEIIRRMNSYGYNVDNFFIDKKGLRNYHLCSVISINHKNLYECKIFDFIGYDVFSRIGCEYGYHFSFAKLKPEINLFSHIRLGFVIAKSFELQIVCSFLTSPGLTSEISYKLLESFFWNLNLRFLPY